ncbi:alkyl/aryl-sulfatase [Parasphingopyxis lamellibrachiae]|uniref:Alkyl sulfatase BDS1-like metallo-beta-lactamase superfamily hydrolase n=1 Tax=Parasphingopyxis lamellibrachiae TaxID=680125 RepID=A0A3D9FBG0_9SPHN|nr:alkyl sulfatase dimerization domain-containing protein [Parasphingopyxis lamellibrachiae]RED15135.1 alkyl sulfatase BDS1-like metallo-beta-lactamase superfamily hydrolase [Parasphingopyxis lamellibrachiae]
MKPHILSLILLASAAPAFAQQGELRDPPAPGTATEATRAANAAVADRLPLAEPSDFADARRGRIARIEDETILGADGSVIWRVGGHDFLMGEAPDTANPSLWRQSALAAEHGLFAVTDGIWQVRGYDLSVMTVIEGETGWIIVDPLTTTETAAAALRLVNETLGERPVAGMLYTHSHADHFGGARGIMDEAEIAARNVPVLAPIGFSDNAVSENLLAGTHMSRRATLMFGQIIPASPTSHIGSGLGPGVPRGTVSLILPTEEISGRGTRRTIDGVQFEFIDAAGTEAPAEFMFYLPEHRALHTAEVATATFHNVLTMRGAVVRDALGWSRAIDHVLIEYADRSDVVLASHHWPSWGSDNVAAFLTGQRDIYRYVHDQTLRRANSGATMVETAEAIAEPDFIQNRFDPRGYYGSLNHNSKAVYQHYFGWWGGVMAEYHRLPHEQSAARYVEAMGGADAVIGRGIEAFDEGDYRWAAELFNHVVFANAANERARNWLAAAYEQLGFQAESGAWRSYYLTASSELRNGVPDTGGARLGNADFLRAVPTLALFDMLASRYAPERLQRDPFTLSFAFPDTSETIAVEIGRSVIVPRELAPDNPTATVTISRTNFEALLLGTARPLALVQSGALTIGGDSSALAAFLGLLEQPEFWFATATP